MASVTATSTVNMALGHLREHDPVSNLYTETSVAAQSGRRWYDISRKQALSEFDWSCARKRILLASHSDAVPTSGEWAYRFQVPSDLLVARYITHPGGTEEDAVPYTMEISTDGTRSIMCGLSAPELVYTFNNEAPETFSTHFVLAHSYLLASYMAMTITGKIALSEKMASSYVNLAFTGAAIDGNQQVSRKPRDAAWIAGR